MRKSAHFTLECCDTVCGETLGGGLLGEQHVSDHKVPPDSTVAALEPVSLAAALQACRTAHPRLPVLER